MAPIRPTNQRHFMTVANAVNKDSISLENKLMIIEQGLAESSLTTSQVVQLLVIAFKSHKNGDNSFKRVLSSLTATLKLLESLGKTKSAKKEINGFEYVEMGDGLKWATCNVGASKPEEKGTDYRWGEVTPGFVGVQDYRWGTYKYMNKYVTKEEYGVVDNLTVLEPADDAASVHMGGSWRTPTVEELTKLTDTQLFDWSWDSVNKGYLVVSKIAGFAGNHIFLPSTTTGIVEGVPDSPDGEYWSSSVKKDASIYAHLLDFHQYLIRVTSTTRCANCHVRAVSD